MGAVMVKPSVGSDRAVSLVHAERSAGMVKVLLFDLGGTLEAHGAVLPGVPEALNAIGSLVTPDGKNLVLCLASDFKMPEPPSQEAVDRIVREYLDILDGLGLRQFFEPVEQHVTCPLTRAYSSRRRPSSKRHYDGPKWTFR